MASQNLFLLIPSMTINSCHPCSHLGSEPCAPFFHYSVQASCIVTTTNFLAVYKAVNQNHTEWGVGGAGRRGAQGAELGGLLVTAARTLDQMSEFYTAG